MSEETQQPQFVIEKIYLKDLSLEIPNAPQVFLEREVNAGRGRPLNDAASGSACAERQAG